MKISSDWVVYYIRSYGVCKDSSNSALGIAIKDVLEGMGCPQDPKGVQVRSPLFNEMHEALAKAGFAKIGFSYDIDSKRLPLFFKTLSERLGFVIE